MPEISLFGWFHTIMGIIAILSVIYTIAKYKVIRSSNLSGKIYLVCTFIAAASALGIFRHGFFGPAHVLAILTLLAFGAGLIAEKTNILGGFGKYFQAISYSATFLFHMIPAITDGLMRLPVDAPIVTDFEDPMLRGFYLAFLVTYLIGVTLQCLWLKKQP